METGSDPIRDPFPRLIRAVLGPEDTAGLSVLAARAGVGKTACLVQVGLAAVSAGKPVLHVALDAPVPEVRGWYDRLCAEATARGLLAGGEAERLSRERARHIHSYLGKDLTAGRLEEALSFLAEVMDFRPHCVLVDGLSFEAADPATLAAWVRVAEARGARLVATALTHRDRPDDPETGLPAGLSPFVERLDRVLVLAPDADGVATLRLVWAGGGTRSEPTGLALDPATWLVRGA